MEDLRDYGDDPRKERIVRNRADAEYRRGIHETEQAQARGPAGSEAREQAYLEMELQREREGGDDW
jgi:hypothetical protein